MKWMLKKIISFFLVLSIMVAGASVASATSFDQDFLVDVMGYGGILSCSPADSSSVISKASEFAFSLKGSGTVQFFVQKLYRSSFYYVDFLCQVNNASGVECSINGQALNKAVYIVDGNESLQRFYGEVSFETNNLLALNFTGSSDYFSFISFLSFDVSYSTAPFSLSPTYTVNLPDGSGNTWTDSSSDGFVFNNTTLGDFQFWIDYSDWQLYDFISLQFILNVASINSISASVGSQSLPVIVDILNSADAFPGATFICSCRIDLSDVIRSDDEILSLCISGFLYDEQSYYVRAMNHLGYVSPSIIDPDVSWLEKIRNAIVEGFNKLVGTDDQMGDFSDDAQQQAGELHEGNDAMNQVEKPEIDSGSADISTIIAPDDLVNTTSWLSDILNAKYISQIMTLAMTLTLASYVLFGKKG